MRALLLAPTAHAHPLGFSGLRLQVLPDRCHAILTLHTRDLGQWFPAGRYPNYVADVCAQLQREAADILELRSKDEPLPISAIKAFCVETGLLEIDIDFPIPPDTTALEIWCKHLVRLPRGHQQILNVSDERTSGASRSLREDTLSIDQDSSAFDIPEVPRNGQPATVPPPPVPRTSGIPYFMLGVEHILVNGYDHLLFLAALLLVCTSLRQAAGIITFFTIAHSVTSALSAMDIVRMSSRIVDPAVAATIAFVGVENITSKHRPAWRACITFSFGLIHGLGFAQALREFGLEKTPSGLIWPLIKFNSGVEAGHLLVAILILPLLLMARRWHPGMERRWVPACSLMVAAVGSYWLVTRILSP